MAIVHARARVDPDDPLEIPLAPIVEWYRIDATRRIGVFLAIGAVSMSVGMVAVAGLVVGRGLGSLAWGLGGIAIVLGGGAITVLGTMRVLWEESYLALRVDGALFVRGEQRRYVRWDDVEDVRHDPARGALVIVRDGHEWVLSDRFAGTSHEDIAKRARAIRRRAIHGMY